MSGHSKWSKVKHIKGVVDAKRSRIFSKLAREVVISARQGGGDPGMNAKLRMVLLKCRSANMPKDNIERAIAKGTGEGTTDTFEELTYEIYGPNGVAVLVELTTDNRNRTAAEIRNILGKTGGSMATSGSVTRLFQRKGQIIIPRDGVEEDALMGAALESGAEDFIAEPEGFEILTEPTEFEGVHKGIEDRGFVCDVARVTSIPTLTVPVEDPEVAKSILKLVEALEEHMDVNDVYTNANLPEETES